MRSRAKRCSELFPTILSLAFKNLGVTIVVIVVIMVIVIIVIIIRHSPGDMLSSSLAARGLIGNAQRLVLVHVKKGLVLDGSLGHLETCYTKVEARLLVFAAVLGLVVRDLEVANTMVLKIQELVIVACDVCFGWKRQVDNAAGAHDRSQKQADDLQHAAGR